MKYHISISLACAIAIISTIFLLKNSKDTLISTSEINIKLVGNENSTSIVKAGSVFTVDRCEDRKHYIAVFIKIDEGKSAEVTNGSFVVSKRYFDIANIARLTWC